MRLSLLRAPQCPDPVADQGRHRMRYALVPGAAVVDAVREGYRINLPERVIAGGHAVDPLVSVAAGGVVIESVKLADDGSGDVIVRLYEALGTRTVTTVHADLAAVGAREVDLLERPLAESALVDGGVSVSLRPFQIVTLRFEVGRDPVAASGLHAG